MTELARQQALLDALLARDGASALHGWLSDSAVRAQRGLQAYQANAGASAERALAAAYPTVQALVGEESMGALARALWHAQPPERGDLACFGAGLPEFMAQSEQLREVPYLSDVARLDALLAAAERAADDEADVQTLSLLAEHEPEHLQLVLRAGTALLRSAYPVVSVWRAHQPGEAFEPARAALAAGVAEQALVWREGWQARALAVDAATARWMQSLLRGDVLSVALAEAGDAFVLEPWLMQAVQRGWVVRARVGDIRERSPPSAATKSPLTNPSTNPSTNPRETHHATSLTHSRAEALGACRLGAGGAATPGAARGASLRGAGVFPVGPDQDP